MLLNLPYIRAILPRYAKILPYLQSGVENLDKPIQIFCAMLRPGLGGYQYWSSGIALLSENAILRAPPIRGFVDPATAQPVAAQMIRPIRIDE